VSVKLITIQQACALAGGVDHPINASTLWRWVKAGRISPPRRTGPKVVRFDEAVLSRELGLTDEVAA
jgi:hypothetical protein